MVVMGFINNLTEGRSRGQPIALPGKVIFQTDRELGYIPGEGYYAVTYLLQHGTMKQLLIGGGARFTRDGKRVLYKREHTLYLLDLASNQTHALDWTTQYSPYDFELSPDQQWLAFTTTKLLHSKSPYPQFNVMVARFDGSEVRQITDIGIGIGRLWWSPNGETILFHWPYDNVQHEGGGLYTIRLDGTDLREVVGGLTSHGAEANWSPDGKTIVFSNTTGPIARLFTVDLGGSNKRQVSHAQFDCRQPVFSPDGTQVLFRSPRKVGAGAILGSTLYAINVDGTHECQVTPDQRIKKYGEWRWATDQNPDWAP